MRLADFGKLTEAEQAVIDGLGTGHATKLGDGTLPGPDAGDDRRVDASLIRWLALGAPGYEAVRLHEKGLQIAGALIVSDGRADPAMKGSTRGLDLEGCRLDQDLGLLGCRFQHTPVLRGAKLDTLNLQGAHLPGLRADGLEARRAVFLRGVEASGEIRLLRARIGSDLDCDDGRFESAFGNALNAEGVQVGGTIFIRRAEVTGEVRLPHAQIGGNVECDGGRFENMDRNAFNADRLETRGDVFLRGVHASGEVRLLGARIGGDLVCEGGRFANSGDLAFSAQGARVSGNFFWREGSHADGALDLTGAEIGQISDAPACWPGPGDLLLYRCRYGAFTGPGTPVSAKERVRWLDLQNPARFGDDFWPQPWEHCAQVLREMGHAEDARKVLIAKEKRQRKAERGRFWHETRGTWREMLRPLPWLRDGAFSLLIAYGHRPLRALVALAVFWGIGWGTFNHVWSDDGFKPNNAFILRSPEWAGCYEDADRRDEDKHYRWRDKYPSTLRCYLAQPEAEGYPAFNAALYSLDTLVPVVDLEMQAYWVPDEKVADWARYYLWVHIAMGWFLALLAVAGFSGLVQTRATSE